MIYDQAMRPDEDSSSRRHLSWRKKLLFSSLITVGFFAGLELTLTVLGVQPLFYEEDPFLGFASTQPLFVEHQKDDGPTYMRVAVNRLGFFNKQRFLKSKPAKSYRIFCVGGSTTYGRPYDHWTSFSGWLGAFLSAADDSRKWEVVNAGGISYASYRTGMLMEELIQYQPDLFIVYSGHNEFLERRTYRAMLETPLVVRNLQSLLHKTRTVSAGLRLLWQVSEKPMVGVEDKDLLPAEVDAILDRSVGPESYTRDDPWRGQVLDHYRFSLGRMAALARAAGAEILFITPAANLRDFSPLKSEHRENLTPADRDLWQGYWQRAIDASSSSRLEEALAALARAEDLDDRYAELHYFRGQLLLRAGRLGEARQALVRARDEDVCPLRALTVMRDTVVQVAAEQSATLIDFAEMMDQQADGGIPGNDLFLDHVHPTIEAHRLLALELLVRMQGLGLVSPRASWGQEAIAEVTHRVKGGVDRRAHALALRNLSKVLGWAGKLEQSGKLALLAVADLPEDPVAHVIAGKTLWKLRGRLDEAVVHYREAVRLKPEYFAANLELGNLLVDRGETEASLEYYERAVQIKPGNADARFQLGNTFFDMGNHERASEEYRVALRLDPQNIFAYRNLGQVALRKKQFQEAIAHYKKALELDPSPVSHCDLGFIFLEAREHDPARECFERTISKAPQHAAAYFGLGVVAEGEENVSLARKMFEQVLSLEPQNRDARLRIEALAGKSVK